jgi:hypothetical protein
VEERSGKHMTFWQRSIDEFRRSFDIRWLVCAAGGTLFILFLTHIPQESIPNVLQFDQYDKLEHIGAYGGMTALYLLALKRQSNSPDKGQGDRKRRRWEVRGWLGLAILMVIGLATLGAVDELTQPLVNRTCDIRDWMSDAAGIAGVGGVFLIWRAVAH